jgi:hypothetical protein
MFEVPKSNIKLAIKDKRINEFEKAIKDFND